MISLKGFWLKPNEGVGFAGHIRFWPFGLVRQPGSNSLPSCPSVCLPRRGQTRPLLDYSSLDLSRQPGFFLPGDLFQIKQVSLGQRARRVASDDFVSFDYYLSGELARSYRYIGYVTSNTAEYLGAWGAMTKGGFLSTLEILGLGPVRLKDIDHDLDMAGDDWPGWVPEAPDSTGTGGPDDGRRVPGHRKVGLPVTTRE